MSDETTNDLLLTELKGLLKVDWDYEDSNLLLILKHGQYALNEMTGAELDYSSNLTAKQLLFDYCRFSYNNKLQYFESSFQREINRLSLMVAINSGV